MSRRPTLKLPAKPRAEKTRTGTVRPTSPKKAPRGQPASAEAKARAPQPRKPAPATTEPAARPAGPARRDDASATERPRRAKPDPDAPRKPRDDRYADARTPRGDRPARAAAPARAGRRDDTTERPRRSDDAKRPPRWEAEETRPRRVNDVTRPRRVDDATRPRRGDDAPRPRRGDDAPRPRRGDDAPRPRRMDDASRPRKPFDEKNDKRPPRAARPTTGDSDGTPRRPRPAPPARPSPSRPETRKPEGRTGRTSQPARAEDDRSTRRSGPAGPKPPSRAGSGDARRPARAFAERRDDRYAKPDSERRPPRPAAKPRFEPAAPAAADAAPRRPAPELPRLSKRMSELGLCSRREADEWIDNGWVRVDGAVAELGTRVHPNAKIEIDEAARQHQSETVTILLHKPVGYVSGQAEDGYEPAMVLILPENRWEEDNLPTRFKRGHLRGLAPAGRLDIDSTGLLVFTQDGRIAKRLVGDDSKVEKEYLVRVEGTLAENGLALLNHGLELDGKKLKPAHVSWQNEHQLRFVLREGKKRQIRRMCELVGLNVTGLKRIRIGSVVLSKLPPGKWRYLRPDESF